MQWKSAADFFAMGGYGWFIWSSYGLALALMLLEPMLARRRHQQALRSAARARLVQDEQP